MKEIVFVLVFVGVASVSFTVGRVIYRVARNVRSG